MRRLALSGCLTVSLIAIHGDALARRVTVEDAEQMAVASNPRLHASTVRVEAADSLADSQRGKLLPSIHLYDEAQYWDSPFGFPTSLFGAFGFKIPAGVMLPNARDQSTNTFTASLDQPLLGLVRSSQELAAKRLDAEAAEAGHRAGEAMLREGIRTGYLRYFEARSLEDIARSSQKELGEQIAVVEAKVKAGVLTNADVLRVKVAVANARQQQIQAHAQGEIARAQLLSAIGLDPGDADIELVEPANLLAAAHTTVARYEDARASAVARRPEMMQLRLAAESADRTHRAKKLALLPDVDLEAGWIHISGQFFAPSDAEYIGVRASWAVWEWGATWYQARAAERMAEAAALDIEDRRHAISTEVATDLAQSEAAHAVVETAEQTIASAEEAYRVMDALVKAGSATTTDLLDAQAALTQTRLNLTRAQYEQAVARVALARAIGE